MFVVGKKKDGECDWIEFGICLSHALDWLDSIGKGFVIRKVSNLISPSWTRLKSTQSRNFEAILVGKLIYLDRMTRPCTIDWRKPQTAITCQLDEVVSTTNAPALHNIPVNINLHSSLITEHFRNYIVHKNLYRDTFVSETSFLNSFIKSFAENI